MGEEHTLRHFRQNWFPRQLNRGNYDQWMEAGGLTLGDKANERVCQILREHHPKPVPAELAAELDTLEEHWWHEIGSAER